nr:ABC-F family ATP-binding cassette domain-containing protein [uncultured Cellulosilyticum sp.]
MSVVLECRKINKEYGEHQILKDVNLEIYQGQKIGIVGVNGAGKTTLANIIMGEIEPTSGQLIWQNDGLRIGYMKQIIDAKMLKETLSGGEKTKALLTQILYNKYDVLILDEPTNHLDYAGVNWLIKQLKAFRGTVIVISHDRYFLDQCVTQIIEIEQGKAVLYKGNYSWYRQEKKKQYEAALRVYLEEEKNKERIQGQIKALRNWSSKAHRESAKKAIMTGNKFGGKEYNRVKAKKMDKAIKSRIKRLEKIALNSTGCPKEEQKVLFEVGKAPKVGTVILEAKDIRKCYNHKVLFEESSFYVKRGEKVGLYGANGCGKTTLIKALLGEIQVEGMLKLSSARRIGYISQEVLGLEEQKTILELFTATTKQEYTKIRSELAQIGFEDNDLNKKVSCLSLGERMKLKLLLMIKEGCEVLILDEPTNHIDLHVREQLEETLAAYNGTILLVTHDRYMLERLCDKLLVFKEKRIIRYEYGFKAYCERLTDYSASKKSEGNKRKQQLEANMILEHQIAYLVGKMSTLEVGSEEYIALDKKYYELMQKRQAY